MPFSKFEIIRSLTQSFTTFEMNKVFIFVSDGYSQSVKLQDIHVYIYQNVKSLESL